MYDSIVLIFSGACYFLHSQGKNTFSLENHISYPDYPYPKLGTNSRFLSDNRDDIKEFDYIRNDVGLSGYENVMEHSGGILGNNLIFGTEDSVIVGLPYAWMGSEVEVQLDDDMKKARFIGTVGKISSITQQSNDLIVPQPNKHNVVVKKGGAVWGGTLNEPRDSNEFGTCQYTTKSNPVENFYTGTSITKGMINVLNHTLHQ